MTTITKAFRFLTAADLMSQEVVMIPQEMSLRKAAHLLSEARVSGAPVIDADGRCVGVISATDFLHWVEHGEPETREETPDPYYYAEWQVLDFEDVPTEEVRHHMTADPVMVSADVLVGELAQKMLDAHIHRLVVVDAAQHPIGIVSSMDILAAVAHNACNV